MLAMMTPFLSPINPDGAAWRRFSFKRPMKPYRSPWERSIRDAEGSTTAIAKARLRT
jgi:hypothetical protein